MTLEKKLITSYDPLAFINGLVTIDFVSLIDDFDELTQIRSHKYATYKNLNSGINFYISSFALFK